MTIPNVMTWIRILCIPILVVVFYLPFSFHHWMACGIFIFAAITDWLDGFLARKLDQTSAFGEFLDPVADKLIVAVALVLLVETYGSPWLAIPAAVIVGREIVISALREWMAEIGKRTNIRASFIGKIKTAVQMLAIALLLSQTIVTGIENKIILLGYFLIYCAALLTLWSMFHYLKIAWRDLSG